MSGTESTTNINAPDDENVGDDVTLTPASSLPKTDDNLKDGDGDSSLKQTEKATAMSNDDVFAQPLLPPPPSASLRSSTHSTSRSSSSGEKKAESSPSTTHSSSSSSSTSSGHKEKVSAEKREKYNAILSSLNYQPPKNAASCADPRYNFEVLKNGTIVDSVRFSRHENKGYYIIGRVPGCDIVAENPTVSRVHAILQFVQFSGKKEEGDKKSEEMMDEPEETGLYLYDLKSTHGTFINKNQVFPQKFYRVHVGHVLKFGSSQRMYIVNGPSEDEEEESDKSVTELLNEKLGKDLERKRLEEEAQLKRANSNSKLPKENIEEEGIDWGMAEDADAESDMRVNPFAMDYDASELTLDNPKKTLKSWFEREGHDLEYEVREKGNGQYVCRIGLPLDGPTDAPVYAESEVKGKKKEAAHDAAMKACQILDSHGILRSSNQESRKRKEKRLEDDDYYSSDDDTFLDRTGSVEKKREKRMRLAGKIEEKVETYESLCAKHSELEVEVTEIQSKLDKAQKVKARADDGDIDIDDYVQMLKADAFDVKKLRSRLREANEEMQRTKKLMDLTRPAELPTHLQTNPTKSTSSLSHFPSSKEDTDTSDLKQSSIKETKADLPSATDDSSKPETPKSNESPKSSSNDSESSNLTSLAAPKPLQRKLMVGPMKPPIPKESPKPKLFGLIKPSEIPAMKRAMLERDVDNQPPPSQHDEDEKLEEDSASDDDTGNAAEDLEFTTASKPKRKRQRFRNQQKNKGNKQDDSFDPSDPKYSTWVPPSNQSGDGRTSLNDKLGY